MIKKLIIFILVAAVAIFARNPVKHFYQMDKQEINQFIKELAATGKTVTQKMQIASETFLTTPYDLTCVGDGPYALYDTKPLVNFQQTNCMALCEHVLALSISDSWENFFNNLQQIRYKDGIIGMKTRNHYTMADWLPQNQWLLEDVSRKIAGSYTRRMTRTISHRKFFQQKGITDMRDVLPDRTITIDYIPLDKVVTVQDKIHSGDVGAILFGNKKDIFAAHMFLIIEKEGRKYVREASMKAMTTLDTPLEKWFNDKLKQKPTRYAGISLMRVRDELNKPGKIIKPWEIQSIKEALP